MTTAAAPVIEAHTLLNGALTIVAALAWNDAAKKVIDYLFPRTDAGGPYHAALSTLVYAIFITLFVIVVIASFNTLVAFESFFVPSGSSLVPGGSSLVPGGSSLVPGGTFFAAPSLHKV